MCSGDFQDDQCDAVHKFNSDEARTLKNMDELAENSNINETVAGSGHEIPAEDLIDMWSIHTAKSR